MDNVLEFLGDYAENLTFETLPKEAVHEVRRRVLDVFGCALGAYLDEPPTIARAHALESTADPGATVLGTNHRTTAELAAFANSVMFRYLDFNDMGMARFGGGHPSDMIASGLAAAEYAGADPKAFITGVVLSYEVVDRLADVVDHVDRGWDGSTLVAIGAAYGAAKVLGLTRAQTMNALSLGAIPNAALRQTRRGALSMWKGAANGNACRNGLFAALLARRGMTGPAEAFTGELGFFNQICGKVLELPPFGGQGRPYKIEESRLKYFPADYEAQTAAHPAIELRQAIGERTEEIEKIDVATYRLAINVAADTPDKWAPENRETADHSIPYVMAVALTTGNVTAADFAPERIADPSLHRLMAKIKVRENKEYTAAYPESTYFHMEVTMASGERHVAEVRYPKGHPKNPMTDADVEEKFRRQAAPLLSPEKMDALVAACRHVEDHSNMSEIMALTELAPHDR